MNTDYFKSRLEKELSTLTTELNSLGRKDPDNPGHWETLPQDRTQETEFQDEVADRMEDFEERESTRLPLEKRLEEVKSALARLAAGTYGQCEKGDHPIEEDRLEANPAARSCKDHMDSDVVIG